MPPAYPRACVSGSRGRPALTEAFTSHPPKPEPRPFIPGLNRYLKELDQDINYRLDHIDHGQPPDPDVFHPGGAKFSGVEQMKLKRRRRTALTRRLRAGQLNEEGEPWSPPDEEPPDYGFRDRAHERGALPEGCSYAIDELK